MTDKPSEMVERVARAIIQELADLIREGEEVALGRNDQRVARAAIEAMREPTTAMLYAGGTLGWEGRKRRWSAMITAALKEG